MSENAAQTNGAVDQMDEKDPAGFSAITTQEDFDRAIQDRLARAEKSWERKNKDIFEKARAFDEMEEKNKSDLEKALERTNELETELNEIRMRDQIAEWKKAASNETGVPIEVLRGSSEEEIRNHAEALKPHFDKPSGFVGSDGFAVNQNKTRNTSNLFAEAIENAF